MENKGTMKSRFLFCGHCDEMVSRTKYYTHKRSFYDRKNKIWQTRKRCSQDCTPGIAAGTSSRHSPKSSLVNSTVNNLWLPEGHKSENDDETNDDIKSINGDDDSEEQFTVDAGLTITDEFGVDEIECWNEPVDNEVDENMDDVTELWHEEIEDGDSLPVPSSNAERHSLINLYTYFILMFQSIFKLSDTAINVLLKFFGIFFATLRRAFPSVPESFVTQLPKSKKDALSFDTTCHQKFVKFICCPSCHSIYNWSDCIVQNSAGDFDSALCSFQPFPNHPQRQHRKECGQRLMKRIKSVRSNVESFHPHLIYCYKSVIDSLQEMILRTGFIEKCELWRERNVPQGIYSDVYDGKVWNDFIQVDGQSFLGTPFNYAFHLNVDWFQPFQHTQHSEGAIYLSILNLPRQERFLKENIILVGVIPGPKEPAYNINSFLKPIVNDLLKLWTGVYLKAPNCTTAIVRAALICVGCDIPAARKACGFLGHRATMGCSRCLLAFPTEKFGEKADYSNFDQKEWIPRTNELHRQEAMKSYNSLTKSERHEFEKKSGVRYSCLLELPYFNAPRMCIIDPMHNLLLGTSKLMVELWKSMNILNSEDFETIQSKVNSFVCPSEIGRIPSKISSSFAGFTAEQWKKWTIYFSPFALKSSLPWNHYNCWMLFVKACWLLCRRSITITELFEGDKSLLEFCKMFVDIYGSNHCTMNMHLHGHIKDCIEDFGPVYSFWCFSFERLNGILGSYHTNNRNISVQIMKRFLECKVYAPFDWPPEYVNDYLPLLKALDYNKGSLNQTSIDACAGIDIKVSALPPIQECAFSSTDTEELENIVGSNSKVFVLCQRCKAVKLQLHNQVGECILGAKKSKHSRSSLVLCKTPGCNDEKLASVEFFAKCSVKKDGEQRTVWMAAVSFYMAHNCKVWFGKPSQVWSSASFTGYIFVPLTNIVSRVLYTTTAVNFGRLIGTDNVNIIVPLDI